MKMNEFARRVCLKIADLLFSFFIAWKYYHSSHIHTLKTSLSVQRASDSANVFIKIHKHISQFSNHSSIMQLIIEDISASMHLYFSISNSVVLPKEKSETFFKWKKSLLLRQIFYTVRKQPSSDENRTTPNISNWKGC